MVFQGKELVDVLIDSGVAKDVTDALALGNAFLREYKTLQGSCPVFFELLLRRTLRHRIWEHFENIVSLTCTRHGGLIARSACGSRVLLSNILRRVLSSFPALDIHVYIYIYI